MEDTEDDSPDVTKVGDLLDSQPYHRHIGFSMCGVAPSGGGNIVSSDDTFYALFAAHRHVMEFSTQSVEIAPFRAYHQDTIFSPICPMVFQMYNPDGDEVMLTNRDFFHTVLEDFRKTNALDAKKHLLEAFYNMRCAVASAGQHIIGAVDQGEVGGPSAFYRAYTYIEIPGYVHGTYDERCRWCASTAAAIVRVFRRMMRSYTLFAHREHARRVIEGDRSTTRSWHDVPCVRRDACVAVQKTAAIQLHFERSAMEQMYKHANSGFRIDKGQEYKLPFAFGKATVGKRKASCCPSLSRERRADESSLDAMWNQCANGSDPDNHDDVDPGAHEEAAPSDDDRDKACVEQDD